MPPKYFGLSLFGFTLQTIYEMLDRPANDIRAIFERELSVCYQAINLLQHRLVNRYHNSFHMREVIVKR